MQKIHHLDVGFTLEIMCARNIQNDSENVCSSLGFEPDTLYGKKYLLSYTYLQHVGPKCTKDFLMI